MGYDEMVWYIKERRKEGAKLFDIKCELQQLIDRFVPALEFNMLSKMAEQESDKK